VSPQGGEDRETQPTNGSPIALPSLAGLARWLGQARRTGPVGRQVPR
jgi:hypothetical protein